MKEITGTAQALTSYARKDGSIVFGLDLRTDAGEVVHVDFDLPSAHAAEHVQKLTYDSRYHQPATQLRAA